MAVEFIAEIGSNHCQNLDRTTKLIDEAKNIGCSAIKFQLFKAEQLYFHKFESQINKMKDWELPENFIPEIERCCTNFNIKFGCSIFSLETIAFLKDYVDYFKIGSYENQWTDLIEAVIATGKPWMISAGMTSPHGIWKIITDITEDKNYWPEVIFGCNSNYPAKPKNCNLQKIGWLKPWGSQTKIGWSDHTAEPGIIYKAIAMGAEYIEFHLDLEDGKGYESTIGHCWKPSQIAEVIHNVRVGEIAEKGVDTGEIEAAKWRTDPEDGFRPLKKFRKELLKNE